MCGRFTLFASQAEVEAAFDIGAVAADYAQVPRYNIAPSQDVAIVRVHAGQRELAPARWGLVPGWSKTDKSRYATINARIETVADKPAYRVPFRRKRCLLPADGFYEWQQTADGKIPHYICRKDRQPLAFAGLWDHWSGEHAAFDSCVIITGPARGLMKSLHDRMPVIVDPAAWQDWLDPGLDDPQAVHAALRTAPASQLQAWPVSQWVNSPAHDAPRCVEKA